MKTQEELLNALTNNGQLDKENLKNAMIEYNKMRLEYARNDPEAAALHGGKFCEYIGNLLLILFKVHDKDRPELGEILNEIDKLANDRGNKNLDISLRLTIPRMLRAAYELRSRRGFLHVNKDININLIDSSALLKICSWILAEFIRLYYTGDMKTADELIETAITGDLPFIDEFRGKIMVFGRNLSVVEKVLVLLASLKVESKVETVYESLYKYGKNHVLITLRRLSERELIYYDNGYVKITPLGLSEADDIIKNKIMKELKEHQHKAS
jgi:hypothetical protein